MEPDYFITECGLPNVLINNKARATTPPTYKTKTIPATVKTDINSRSSLISETHNKNLSYSTQTQGMSKAYKNLQNEMIKQKLSITSQSCNNRMVNDGGRLQSSGDS